MPIDLRPATAADAQLVYDITEAAMRRYVEQTFGPWVPSFQQALIAKSFDPATFQIILADGIAAGLLSVLEFDTHTQLEKLYLLPNFQRQGIGSHLLKRYLQGARNANKPVRLRVLAVNDGARRLYERLGFVVSCRTPERIFMEYTG